MGVGNGEMGAILALFACLNKFPIQNYANHISLFKRDKPETCENDSN